MDEPIIYRRESPIPFLKTPAECLYDKLNNALMLDDKDEFLRLINDPEFEPMRQLHRSQYLFLREFNANRILRNDAPQIAMALINGETKGIIDDPQIVFKDGWTPLHLATATPSPKLIKHLIERGDPFDVPCDYAPLNLKQVTPLELALEVIDYGYVNGHYQIKRPWTLRRSMFELFHYVCHWQKRSVEVIRLLVQNTQNKERVRKAFVDSANEGKLIKVAVLFLAAPELFLSTSLEGGSVSSIDELYLNLNSLDKTTDIQDGLALLLDVFYLIGHMLIAYMRLNDPMVRKFSYWKRCSFLFREAADKKLGISSRDDYLLSFFKPVCQHALDPPCIALNNAGTELHIEHEWEILPFELKKDIDIDYINSILPSLRPHKADYLRKAIDIKLSVMPNISTLFEGTTRTLNKGGTQRSSFPRPRSIKPNKVNAMDEPIIYCRDSVLPYLKTPAECLYDKLNNALMLDDKDEFLRLINDPEFEPMRQLHRSQLLFLREFNANKIVDGDAPQIAMALINGETKGIIDDPQLVFKDGWTPLHLATATPSPKLIKYLIQRGDPVDVPCDYAPLNLKQVTPLDLALEAIDYGYVNERYVINRPWTLRSSMFELFHYVCHRQNRSVEVIRLLVQNTQNKERVRKAFVDSANEGKLVKVAALFLAAPELFLSTSLEGGSVSSIDKLYFSLNSLDKTTDIQDGLALLLDVFDLIGHMLVAYMRINDPMVWQLKYIKRCSFLFREAADKKIGISSRDDYLLSFFKPVSQHALEPPCHGPNIVQAGSGLHIAHEWKILPFELKKDIDIDYINRILPSLKPHNADYLRKAIDIKLSVMPNICTLFESTTRTLNKEGTQRSSFHRPRSIELPMVRSFCTEAANVRCRLDFKLIPRFDRESRVMNPTKLESFISAVRLSRFPMIAKRLMK